MHPDEFLRNYSCMSPQSFLLEYRYQGRWPEVKQLLDRSLNASGIRDTA
jgi:hypothetical protein